MKWILMAVAIALLGVVVAVQALTPNAHQVLLSPRTITVQSSSSLPAQAKAQEAKTAPLLFDRDTTTEHVVFATSHVVVTFGGQRDFTRLKVYDAAPYRLSVEAEEGGSWTPVDGLQHLNLTKLADGWHTFAAGTPVTTTQLRLTITPASGGDATGLREIELWGRGPRRTIANGASLLKSALNKALPPAARVYTATPAQGFIGPLHVAGGKSDDPSDNTFTFDVARHPAEFKRAWLTYETYGVAHWVGAVRSINGRKARGGWPTSSGDGWTQQIERINPRWLVQGENKITFSAPMGTTQAYSVRNLRVIVELADGTNFVRSVSANRPDTSTSRIAWVHDGDPDTGWSPYGGHAQNATAQMDFDKPVVLDAVQLDLADTLAGQIKITVLRKGKWVASGAKSVNAAQLSSGWNTIPLPPSAPVDGVRLRFSGGPGSTGEIRELVPLGSEVGTHFGPPHLHITYPDAGQYRKRSGYVRGYLTPATDSSGPAQILVGGKPVPTDDGSFGVIISKDDVGLSKQASDHPWSVEVDAVYPDGRRTSATVNFTDQLPAPDVHSDGVAPPYSQSVVPSKPATIRYAAAALEVVAGAVATKTTLHIRPLTKEELPALGPGMTNVTRGPRKGYRFLPHGEHFRKNIKIRIPYDPTKIPDGMSAKDVHTYYFDQSSGHWVALQRVSVDTASKEIVSYTNHFTDMIDATITVPSHPTPTSFNGNTIKGIRAADPGAGVNLIKPPKANNMGDARLSYPIQVPPGRAGLQPKLAIQYDSGGGDGWLGVGWSLPMKAVTVSTRWGVPRYSPTKETETYDLNGHQLTPVAYRGQLRPRNTSAHPNKIFHRRVEGAFQKIVRHGSSPKTYWWEVTAKNGTRYFYGGDPADGQVPNAVLKNGNGDVFKWALREVLDTNGNTMRYHYDHVSDLATESGTGSIEGTQIYLKKIDYTGHGDEAGLYHVIFFRDHNEYGRRPDVRINARGGFLMVTADLLRRIVVYYRNNVVRSYTLTYHTGPFDKSLLASIEQFGANGKAFPGDMHTFKYYDDIKNKKTGAYDGFGSAETWKTNDGLSAPGMLGVGKVSALSTTKGTTTGGYLYLGVGPLAGKTKTPSGGFKIGYSHGSNSGLISLIDVNGDGLPDEVYKKDGHIYYRPNESGPGGNLRFGSPVPLPTLRGISHQTSTTMTAGVEGYWVAPALSDTSNTYTVGNEYFTDVNGDGIPDFVMDGTVWFGHLYHGVPTYTTNSDDTPAPLGPCSVSGGCHVDSSKMLADFTSIYQQELKEFPLTDAVRRWVAPYDGVVKISGDVQLIKDDSSARAKYKTADGVRVSIQHNGTVLWHQRIKGDDYKSYAPGDVSDIPVHAGDRLYFRVQSVFDGKYDQVAWDPKITYLNVPATTDANGLNPYQYQASKDFVYAGRTSHVRMTYTGTVHLSGDLHVNGAVTDDVTLLVYKNGTPIISRTLKAGQTGSIRLDDDVNVTKGDVLRFRAKTDSPIDLTQISWSPGAVYTSVPSAGSVKDANGNAQPISVPVTYEADFYPGNALTAPQRSWLATKSGKLTVKPSLTLPSGDQSTNATVTFTVKTPGALLAKSTFPIVNGKMQGGGPVVVDIKTPEKLYFDFSTRDAKLHSTLTYKTQASYTPAADASFVKVPSALHWAEPITGFFQVPYRGWSLLAYNGNLQYAAQPILDLDPAQYQSYVPKNYEKFKNPGTVGYDVDKARFYPVTPVPAPTSKETPSQPHWSGPDPKIWMEPTRMSSSRLGPAYIQLPHGKDYAGGRAVSRISSNSQNATGLISTTSTGTSTSDLDFLDMNGDGFPDIVGNGHIQYTAMNGALEQKVKTVNFPNGETGARASYNLARTISSGSIASTVAGVRGLVGNPKTRQGSNMPALGYGGSITGGYADAQYNLIDLNGDGLPDLVTLGKDKAGNPVLNVRFNLGYSFSKQVTWGLGQISHTKTVTGGINASYNVDNYSFAGGVSVSESDSKTKVKLIDMNGDGLPDYVVARNGGLEVYLNTGSGFATTPIAWRGSTENLEESENISLGGGLYLTDTFGIPPWIRIVVNPGVNETGSVGYQKYALRDINGDGYPDQLYSDSSNQITVALNQHGRTDLLESVTRPLGAKFTLNYTRAGDTYHLPKSRWNLTSVSVDANNGHIDEGANTQLRTFTYADPNYDRYERRFYGYGTVTSQLRNTSHDDALYREVVSTYLNNRYYTKGLLVSRITRDASKHKYLETDNTYQFYDVALDAPLPSLPETTDPVFPQLVRVDHKYYEGQPSAGQSTYQTYSYDKYGNVTDYTDAGDATPDDNVVAHIDYYQDPDHYIVDKPTSIVVNGDGHVMRDREAQYDPSTGNLLQVSQDLADGSAAVTDLSYDEYGNLTHVVGPANLHGQRYTVDIGYDGYVHSHVTSVRDSFGYASQATYNYLFGKPVLTTDTNGNQTLYEYDQYGRTTRIYGPFQMHNGEPTDTSHPTIAFSYYPTAPVPWALTKHLDRYRDVNDPIETALFIDGLKRVVQTKKDATIYTGTGPQDVMVVSGRKVFDFAGRVVEQYYPVTEPVGTPGAFNKSYDTTEPPTRTTYDVLDRPTKITLPDGTRTKMAYGFGDDRDNLERFLTTVTDADGNVTKTYRDVRHLITSVEQSNAGKTIWTSYHYDPLKEITRVVDAAGNTTKVGYDNLGRRTFIDNPDSGRVTWDYDTAGNVIRKVTSDLRAKGKAIRYDYDYNRLKSISYPEYPRNDVTYTYGGPGAPDNRAGRIVKVTDGSGSDVRSYGPLGEVIKSVRTVASHTQGKSAHSPEVYTTEYVYDTWGRLQAMVYPDGEALRYYYNSGGLVDGARSVKNGAQFVYLKDLEYDKFGQRVYQVDGNGVVTTYQYRPDNRRLARIISAAPGKAPFQNLAYTYDPVGNVLGLANQVAVPHPGDYGGPVTQSFHYDELYRLTSASGTWRYAPGKQRHYTLNMRYNAIDNIVHKDQLDVAIQPSGKSIEQKATSYDWAYAYTGPRPHAPTRIGQRVFSYDANGNQTGWKSLQNGTHRTITWDENNRIVSIADNGHTTRYVYDASGRRIIKRGPQGETVYVNKFFTIRNRAIATKSIFIGKTRLASKLSPDEGQGGPTTTGGSGFLPGLTGIFHRSQAANQNALNALKNPHLTGRAFPGQGLGHRSAKGNQNAQNVNKNPNLRSGSGVNNVVPDGNFLYFYHPDHLGSTAYVTDGNAKLFEHMEYFPFGETWVDQHSNTQRVPYLFSGKEYDEATGLYYFGARYYDPRTSVWESADPALGRYFPSAGATQPSKLPGAGGVFNPVNLGLFTYAHLNPLLLLDPNGAAPFPYQNPNDGYNPNVCTGGFVYDSGQWESLDYNPRYDYNPNAAAGILLLGASLIDPEVEGAGLAADAGDLALDGGESLGALGHAADEPFKAGLNVTKGTPQVLKNKARGDAFRDEIADLMKKEGRDVQTEVTKKTPFGRRVIDVEVSKDGKVLGGIETKTGKSRYLPSQRAKDEWLRQNGYPVNVVRDP